MKDLSVVIPVYNTGEHLPQLFEQLLQFPAQRVDIILVNDGSQDNSKALCEEMAAKTDNFFLIDKPNGGVSSARNTGIEALTSRYVWFCDADDRFSPEKIIALIDEAAGDASPDALCFSYEQLTQSSGQSDKCIFPQDRCSGREAIVKYNSYDGPNNLSTVWNKLFLVATLHQHKLRFDTSMHHSEDRAFNLNFLYLSQEVVLSPQLCYQYIRYPSGTLATSYSASRIEDTKKSDRIFLGMMQNLGKKTEPLADMMRFNYMSMLTENIIKSQLSFFAGYRPVKKEYSSNRGNDYQVNHFSAGRSAQVLCQLLNWRLPFLYYSIFWLKEKLK
ncbi:glycosyltransferase family 2 protein [Kalamiella sp. sgz302252]|uniref:glycosyltransferase family 2 protein n=1 Tax=Pantoea sp. sgz302252 TaxID=3341827 RepID=UPI0036D36DDE